MSAKLTVPVHFESINTTPAMAVAATVGAAALLSLASPALAAKEFDPQFYSNSWGGTCATGKLQTPIDLPARFDNLPPVPDNLVTTIRMPLVKNPEIVNKGSAIQVRGCFMPCVA